MTNGKYIVVIDLGTSRFLGKVGQKDADGALQILATDVEEVGTGCMRRGNIVNIDTAKYHIGCLIKKLKNRVASELSDIVKVYIGIGGQSLHSVEYSVPAINLSGSVVSGEDIRKLEDSCRRQVEKKGETAYSLLPVAYHLDGKPIANPSGAMGGHLKASYKAIVGRPLIRTQIEKTVADAGYELAGILVSPLALAQITVGKDDKTAGCIFVNFGDDTTSVVVYQNNALAYLGVVPFGSNLITSDLSKGLGLDATDAEALKQKVNFHAVNSKTSGEAGDYTISGIKVEKPKADMIAGARAREIIDNVQYIVKIACHPQALTGRVILAGEMAELTGIKDLVDEAFKLTVTYAEVPEAYGKCSFDDLTAIGLLMEGSENCITIQETTFITTDEEDEADDDVDVKEDVKEDNTGGNGIINIIKTDIFGFKPKNKKEPQVKPKDPKKTSIRSKVAQTVTTGVNTLFGEDD